MGTFVKQVNVICFNIYINNNKNVFEMNVFFKKKNTMKNNRKNLHVYDIV